MQPINSLKSVSKLSKLITLLGAVLLLLNNSVSATDSYPINFIIPEETATPEPTATPQEGGTGGGGSRWTGSAIVPISVNPPEVQLKIQKIEPEKSIFDLIIKNEGTYPWEYIYTWTLKKINETTGNYTTINTWRASKYLKPNNAIKIPISIEDLHLGRYMLSVEVNYGDYVSKAHTEFEITGQQVQAGKIVNQWGIWLVLIILIGFVAFMYINSSKQQKMLNRIIRQKHH